MDAIVIIVLIVALMVFLFMVIRSSAKKQKPQIPLPAHYKKLLEEHVNFYQELNAAKRSEFEYRIQHFLADVRITGVKTEVEDLDRVLVAASAIIPTFGFPGWEYMNLNEVLLYPDAFNDSFDHEGGERDTLGIVGTGPYQNIMILSRHGLREGFSNNSGKTNVAIHEFVHLLDKTDGAVDGIPEFMLSKQYIIPWLDLMRKEIQKIMADNSDINPYGATNQAEFFAVVAEYFFERPDLLQEKHPELYQLLSQIFRQRGKGSR
jgi:MtfA peptidase